MLVLPVGHCIGLTMTARIEFDYLTFYNGKEHPVKAASSFEAQQIAVKHFKPIKSKTHMVHVYLIKEKSNDI